MSGVAFRSLAGLAALAHLSLIVLLIVGGPVARRWRGLARPHLVAVALTLAVNLAGADRPLTDWEKAAITASGTTPYAGGFVEHYLVNPLYSGGMTVAVNTVIVAAWLGPTLWAYTAMGLDRRRAAAVAP